jgi:hypothetical protein
MGWGVGSREWGVGKAGEAGGVGEAEEAQFKTQNLAVRSQKRLKAKKLIADRSIHSKIKNS